ncbi:MAG TPA: 2-amino-4-hydroxy-6-hydroxymethyldihydropteridine diphosphokinase [Devosiaceae bacterium]|nr:2-amino-4-hydroxy-6-hydroxymethyldihydropteridine diphosphokinase [Devosiaceae bacterium]
MARAWLALGANIGDPAVQLEEAVGRISATPGLELVARSSIIRTAPWGKTDQPDFYNMAVTVETSLDPHALLLACLGIEAAMGRQRLVHWGPRLIDLDIVAYERVELDLPDLKLPHPFAHERDFVLVPLREIAPDVAKWIVQRKRVGSSDA